jgi:ribosomal protein L10
VVEGELVDPAGVASLALLPGKLELRGMLAGTLQSPLRNLAGTLQSLLGHLRNALEQRQQKLESN